MTKTVSNTFILFNIKMLVTQFSININYILIIEM